MATTKPAYGMDEFRQLYDTVSGYLTSGTKNGRLLNQAERQYLCGLADALSFTITGRTTSGFREFTGHGT